MRKGGFNEPTALFYLSLILFGVAAVTFGIGAKGIAAGIGVAGILVAGLDWIYSAR